MTKTFSYKLLAKKGNAKAGVMQTPHGEVATPVFMPVGTVGSVKAMSPEDVRMAGGEIVLGNTYHLYLRPGDGLVREMGGLQEFMRWQGPMLTDSGGYQVSSLGLFREESKEKLAKVKPTKIDEDGVTFWSHLDGSEHRFTPEKSIEIQENLGADVIMAFDEATPDRGREYAREAMQRTHNWLVRSKKRWEEMEEEKGEWWPQALFGIVQGGGYEDLRRESVEFVVKQDLPGMAIGGGSIGQDAAETEENVSWIRSQLPSDKPVYLMGVGKSPSEAVAAVLSGADMFDCVAPTRIARMGGLYVGELEVGGMTPKFASEHEHDRMNIDNRRFANDRGVIDDKCDCYTCRQGFSRAYLHHLFRSHELLYYRLASIHNTRVMIRTVGQVRAWVMEQG